MVYSKGYIREFVIGVFDELPIAMCILVVPIDTRGLLLL